MIGAILASYVPRYSAQGKEPTASCEDIAKALTTSNYVLSEKYLSKEEEGKQQYLSKEDCGQAKKSDENNQQLLKFTIKLKDKSTAVIYVVDANADSFLDKVIITRTLPGKEAKIIVAAEEIADVWAYSLKEEETDPLFCKPAEGKELLKTLFWLLARKGYYQPSLP